MNLTNSTNSTFRSAAVWTAWAKLLIQVSVYSIMVAVIPSPAKCDTQRDRYFRAEDGTQLHYIEAGTGPRALIFIPGWLMPAEIFASQVAHFQKKYRVLVLSPRSQGKSALYKGSHTAALRAQDIADFVTAAEAEKDFVLVGWSLGVMEGLDYIHRYQPEGLKGLVLIENSIGEGEPPKNDARTRIEKALRAQSDRVTFLKEFVRNMFKTPMPEDFLAMIDRSALRPSGKVDLELLYKPYPREYYRDEIYSHKGIPVWYAITPRFKAQGDLLVRNHPKATVTLFEGAGHALFVDQRERFNAGLDDFLGKVR